MVDFAVTGDRDGGRVDGGEDSADSKSFSLVSISTFEKTRQTRIYQSISEKQKRTTINLSVLLYYCVAKKLLTNNDDVSTEVIEKAHHRRRHRHNPFEPERNANDDVDETTLMAVVVAFRYCVVKNYLDRYCCRCNPYDAHLETGFFYFNRFRKRNDYAEKLF